MTLEVTEEVDIKTGLEIAGEPGVQFSIRTADGDATVNVPMEDFLASVVYVLTNTDLVDENDVRLAFRDKVAHMAVGPGFNPGGRRLVPSRTEAVAPEPGA